MQAPAANARGRFIPARAENTFSSPAALSLVSEDPRACGEHVTPMYALDSALSSVLACLECRPAKKFLPCDFLIRQYPAQPWRPSWAYQGSV